MRGKIKWFSTDKGFGFVTDESGADHYLSKLDFKDQGYPRSGDRVQCKSCHRLMVPRIITGPPLGADRQWTPVPKRSVCPFCASTHETFPPSAGEQMAELAQWIFMGVVLLIVGAMFLRSWY